METTNIFWISMALLTVSYILIGGFIMAKRTVRLGPAIAKLLGMLLLTVCSGVIFFMIMETFDEKFTGFGIELKFVCFTGWIVLTFLITIYWSEQIKTARILRKVK